MTLVALTMSEDMNGQSIQIVPPVHRRGSARIVKISSPNGGGMVAVRTADVVRTQRKVGLSTVKELFIVHAATFRRGIMRLYSCGYRL